MKRADGVCSICNWTFVMLWLHLTVCQLSASICMSLQRSYLQVEELQAVKLVEDVMGQGSEPTAVHVEALELL